MRKKATRTGNRPRTTKKPTPARKKPSRGRSGQSAKLGKVIAKAWDDPSFQKRLLAAPKIVLAEEGVKIAEGLDVRVVQNTDTVVHLILPARPPSETAVSRPPIVIGSCNCWQGEAWN